MLDKYIIEKEIKKDKVYLVKIEYYLKKYQESQNLYEVLSTLQKKKFPNLVEIKDLKIDKKEGLIIVTEEACEWDLRQMMKNMKEKFDISEKIKCLLHVIQGLLDLKELKIFHRDIKPDNIVYDGENYKIIDFDRAKVNGNSEIRVHSLDIGTKWYQAPEIVANEPYSHQCDVWSLGSVFYFLLFEKEENKNDKIVIPNSPKYDDKIIQLLLKMLEKDQRQRITLKQLQVEAQQLQKNLNNNNSNLSIMLEQNKTSKQNTSSQLNTTSSIVQDQNELEEKFRMIMETLINKEQNLQKMIYLYQFWGQRLENKSPDEQKLRTDVQNKLLEKIVEGKENKIKISIFNSLDQIKQQLKCFDELQEFYDF